ncbi:MAG: hypothetical protein NTY64_14380, partial [Deltaproteobacteria bacterium]|nr:hypothetical protein [Deltaproteobacteria bacterium]
MKLPKEVGANDGGKYLFSVTPLVGEESGAQADDEHLEREEDAGDVQNPKKPIKKANPKVQTKPTISPALLPPVLQNVKDSITFEKVPQETLILKLKTEKPLLLSDRLFHAGNGKARIRFSGYEGASSYPHLKTRFRITLDASSDEGEYIFSPNDSGVTWSVLDDNAEKLVLHMPDGANLDGRMPPGRRPIWYFWVSKDKKPEIFLNHKVVLIDPNGEKIVKGGETGAWHELPRIEGLWGIEPDDVTYVNFRGIPPYMAKGDKSRFFIPSNNNKSDKSEAVIQDFSHDNKEPFQKGVFGRAYLLADKTNLQIPFGSEKGDGSYEYFPSQEGTLEFWFRPNWNSMELKPSDRGTRLLSASNGKFHLSYYFDPVNDNVAKKNSLYSQLTGEGLNMRTAKPHTMRGGDYRSTIFSAGQWYHIAMVWYHPYSTIRKSEKTLEIFTYVDGKCGQIFGHVIYGINYKVVK